MLIVYRQDTGEVLDNTGTSLRWPEGPPDDLALVNVPEAEHGNVALLRLHDEDDADLVAQVLDNRHHVESGQVVIDGPYPPPPEDTTPDPTEDLTARLEALAAKATPTVKELIGALLGTQAGAVGQVAAQARGPQ